MSVRTVNGIICGEGLHGPPSIADTCKGRAIVLGSGRSVWDDYERFKMYGVPADVVAINMGCLADFPIHHLATLHPEMYDFWHYYRTSAINALPFEGHVNTKKCRKKNSATLAKNVWGMPITGCNSGIFGTMVALGLGYEKVVLVGVPFDTSGHFYDSPYRPKKSTAQFGTRTNHRRSWESANITFFNDRVRSMSGNTRKWLGGPTEEWLIL